MTGSGDARQVSAGALAGMLCDGGEIALVDVREAGQFGLGHMLHAASAPYSRLELTIPGLVPNPQVRLVLIDQSDGVAARAARRLQALGYDNIHILAGGVDAWAQEGFELFEGVHVPSKAFGEILAEENGTAMIAPADLATRMGEGNAPLLLDIRPYGEYHHQTVPGAINCPGVELVYRIADLSGDETTPVVVTCAGRTRGIIAVELLRRSGLKNPVVALKDGTMGWYRAGFDLSYGETAQLSGRSPAAMDWSRQAASRMAEDFSVPFLTLEQLNAWRADRTRTLYVLDVREPGQKFFEPFELRAAHGRLKVSQAIVESDLSMDAFLGIVLGGRGQVTDSLGQGRIFRHHHAAAAGGHDLVAVEAETGQTPKAAGRSAAIAGAQGFRRVLDYRKIELCGDRQQRIQIGRMAEHVNREDRPDPPAAAWIAQHTAGPAALAFQKVDRPFDIHLPSPWLGIHKDRPGPSIAHGVGRRDEGETGHQNLVVRQDPGGEQGNMQRRRAVHSRDRVPGAQILGEVGLKTIYE